MKNKFWLVVITILVLLLESTVLSFADAVLYDMEPAEYYVYVATPDGGLNMRHGPGSDYTKVMDKRIPDDTKLYIKYVSGKWGYTTYEGNEGWVYLPQTTKNAPVAKAYEKAAYYVYVATPDGGLNMRQGPGSDYAKVMDKRIPDDTELYIKYVSGKWGYTTYEGNEGWVYLPQTTTTPPSAVVQPSEENIDVKESESIDPMQENKPSESAEKETEKIDDSMISTILLVACLLFVVVILSVILLIIINLKKR